jgi:hypothetical protein
MTTDTGLVRYDAMCQAIAECHRVDEVKDLRDKARALEVYAQQARNVDAERKASEVRIRAERRAGQLLNEMKQSGQRDSGGKGKIASRPATQLSDLGITRDQSSKWQQLANVPDAEFEKAVSSHGPKPTTEGIIHSSRPPKPVEAPRMDPTALWLWGRIKDFEREGILVKNPSDLFSVMTASMQDDISRILPDLAKWLDDLC